ncbi:MAG TPA: ATPase, T2SS/T4P/T4SS family [Opitutaceae bacterium]|jgi:type IV pilus assembly protein PilB|nr:ATPase, T2SS/T4P/T4SS family [Opitutaceae bacterium]
MVSSLVSSATDPAARGANEAAPEGPIDFERLFDTYGITPMPLGTARIPLDLIRAYQNWSDFLGGGPDLAEEPWLPVGSIGPLLILGHYQPPRKQPALLPPWFSGRALVPEDSYRRIAAELRDRQAQNLRHSYDPPPKGALPPEPPGYADDRAALQFLQDHFVMEPAVRAAARAGLERNMPLSDLPMGLREAVLFLRQRGAVVDVRFLDVPKELLAMAQRTTQTYHGFCYKRTPGAYFVAFHEMPPHPACDEFTAMFRAEVEDELRRPIYFALTELDQLKQAVQLSRAADVRVNAPVQVEAGSFTQAVEIKLTTEMIRRIDPDRLGTTDEQLVHWVIGQAILANAQDLHVMFERSSGVFRISKDGILQTLYTFSEQRWGMIVGLLRDMAKMSGPFFQTISSRFSVLFDGSPVDFRVEATPFRDFDRAQNMSLRLRKMDNRIRTLGDLQMREADLRQMRRLISRPDGMFLFTGPTCHGKSTTIYAALNELNRPEIKIMTAEDPIEQLIEGAHQAQVDNVKGLTFASLLRSFLRSAPNIILVGEIRDPETAEMAVGAAHTGHLVFSTLHVRSAAAVPTRLADLKIPAGMVADTMIAAQSQRLIRSLCPVCKMAVKTTPVAEKTFVDAGLEPPATMYLPGQDPRCARCQGRGYSGVTAIMELLEPDDEIFELIRAEAGMRAISNAAEKKGFKPLRVQALTRVAEGLTSLEEAQRKVLFTVG